MTWSRWIAGSACVAFTFFVFASSGAARPLGGGAAPAMPDTTDPSSALPAPDSSYGPGEVVRLQLEALATNDEPYENAGIETAFRFASPANKRATGPLDAFIELVRNRAYRPMIDHRSVRYSEVQMQGDAARQAVVLTGETGEEAAYLFILSRQQDSPHAGCWMTDGVQRVDLQALPTNGQDTRKT